MNDQLTPAEEAVAHETMIYEQGIRLDMDMSDRRKITNIVPFADEVLADAVVDALYDATNSSTGAFSP